MSYYVYNEEDSWYGNKYSNLDDMVLHEENTNAIVNLLEHVTCGHPQGHENILKSYRYECIYADDEDYTIDSFLAQEGVKPEHYDEIVAYTFDDFVILIYEVRH